MFEGRFKAVRSVSFSTRNSQTRNLTQLKRRLTKKSKAAGEEFDVEMFVGKISSNDFRSLRYYLDVKYLKKEDYESKDKKKKSSDDED